MGGGVGWWGLSGRIWPGTDIVILGPVRGLVGLHNTNNLVCGTLECVCVRVCVCVCVCGGGEGGRGREKRERKHISR